MKKIVSPLGWSHIFLIELFCQLNHQEFQEQIDFLKFSVFVERLLIREGKLFSLTFHKLLFLPLTPWLHKVYVGRCSQNSPLCMGPLYNPSRQPDFAVQPKHRDLNCKQSVTL